MREHMIAKEGQGEITVKKSAASIITAAFMLAIMLAAMLPVFSRASLTQPEHGGGDNAVYEKRITYVADIKGGIKETDANWDTINEVFYGGGELNGACLSEAGVYGIGFRHKTPGRGISTVGATVRFDSVKPGYAMFALRTDDYTDILREEKGIFLCVNEEGSLGIADPVYRRVVTEETGYSFAEGREIYLEDDADANVITVSFGDGGRKVKIADCVIDGGGRSAVMRFEGEAAKELKVDFRHEIFRDGYVSVTSNVGKVYFSNVSVTLPSYSAVPPREPEETVFGGVNISGIRHSGSGSGSEKTDGPGKAAVIVIILGAAAALLTALTVFLAVKLKKTHRRYKGG